MSSPDPSGVSEPPRSDTSHRRRDLAEELYALLRRLAAAQLGKDRQDQGLDPTDLANEAFLRLMRSDRYRRVERADVLAQAATVIRNLLVDHARAAKASKRGAHMQRLDLTDDLLVGEGRAVDLLDLDQALKELAELDPRQARVVELRYFAGLNGAEVAQVLGLARRTVELDWNMARAWLRRWLERGGQE